MEHEMSETIPRRLRCKPGKEIKSRFSAAGAFSQKIPRVRTVGELKTVLAQLPDGLPLNGADPEELGVNEDEGGYTLHWYNVGQNSEQLGIDEDDW
jgi:hypothetical protein